MSIELKIKSKHLSVEAKIIRFEENKLTKQIKWLREHQQPYETEFWKRHSLNYHRRHDVRNENRATFLARAFIAGKAYSSVEQKRKEENEWEFVTSVVPRVLAMVKKYHNIKHEDREKLTKEDILKWATISK